VASNLNGLIEPLGMHEGSHRHLGAGAAPLVVRVDDLERLQGEVGSGVGARVQ
jgi:hypothetical protein